MEAEYGQIQDRSQSPIQTREWDRDALKQVAHIKRCMECYWADPDFRESMAGSPDQRRKMARSRGIKIDPNELDVLFRIGAATQPKLRREDCPEMVRLWLDWSVNRLTTMKENHARIHNVITDSRYKAWHERQIARCNWELGPQNQIIGHATLVFELAKGCSVGCWFCGFNAEKLQKVFRYTPDNRQQWFEILAAAKEVLGISARSGFCYWASEPFDNPDYLKFLKDYHEILGILPVTTTATSIKNLTKARELLEYCKGEGTMKCRFSVLSLEMLRQIHSEFSAEDLLLVELVLQNRESITPFHTSGKFGPVRGTAKKNNDPPELNLYGYDTGTISCVTGFLVNMVERDIRLVSPCRSSEQWPLGFRVFWQQSFDDAESFRDAISDAIEHHMHNSLKGDQVVRFNEHLDYIKQENGFSLEAPFRTYNVKDNALLGSLGELIDQGNRKTSEIIAPLVENGHNFFAVTGALQHMFDKGLIE